MKCEDCYWRKPVVLDHPKTGLPHKLWYACWYHPSTHTPRGAPVLLREDPVNCLDHITTEEASRRGRKRKGSCSDEM